MASFFVALSKPQLLKRIFCNNFPKTLYHFSSSANEHKPDPNPHRLTHESQPHPHKTEHYKKVEALCKDQRFNDAKQLIYNLAQKGFHKNEDLFILLINGYSNATAKYDAYQNSVRIFKKMDKLGVPKTVKSYNHLFDVLLSANMFARAIKKSDEAEKVFMKIKGLKFEPDLDTYNSMINGYARVRKMGDVERLVAEMKRRNIEPDLVTYYPMVNGYVLVKKMEDVGGIELDLFTYVTMIKGYVKADSVDVRSCLGRGEDYVKVLELLAIRDAAR
ncbi:pentatricopeptide repeat-containing protein [Tanacetum coccineum]